MIKFVTLLICCLLFSGCETLSYYGQAVRGQWGIIHKRETITTLIKADDTDEELRQRLQTVERIRLFADQVLALPVEDAYSDYADVGRDFVVWNVFAAPVLSVRPKQWCFLIAGCVSYRGYFSRDDAIAKARQLQQQGYDIHVGGVKAYSTLGWFDDPVLNTFVHKNDIELSALLFHELAHRQFYVKGDTAFNESFATAVEQAGLRLWLMQHQEQGTQTDFGRYLQKRQQRQQVIALVLETRERLQSMYADESLSDDQKLVQKQAMLAVLQQQYLQQQTEQGWDSRYDEWVASMNNAKLAAVGSYHQYVEFFSELLTRHQGDMPAFYRAVAELADSTTVESRKQLLTR